MTSKIRLRLFYLALRRGIGNFLLNDRLLQLWMIMALILNMIMVIILIPILGLVAYGVFLFIFFFLLRKLVSQRLFFKYSAPWKSEKEVSVVLFDPEYSTPVKCPHCAALLKKKIPFCLNCFAPIRFIHYKDTPYIKIRQKEIKRKGMLWTCIFILMNAGIIITFFVLITIANFSLLYMVILGFPWVFLGTLTAYILRHYYLRELHFYDSEKMQWMLERAFNSNTHRLRHRDIVKMSMHLYPKAIPLKILLLRSNTVKLYYYQAKELLENIFYKDIYMDAKDLEVFQEIDLEQGLLYIFLHQYFIFLERFLRAYSSLEQAYNPDTEEEYRIDHIEFMLEEFIEILLAKHRQKELDFDVFAPSFYSIEELDSAFWEDIASITTSQISQMLEEINSGESNIVLNDTPSIIEWFKVNSYLKLGFTGESTIIFVNNRPFNQCSSLVLNIPSEDIPKYDEINSIDEASNIFSHSDAFIYNYSLLPIEEFRGHCSNLQVWEENEYDTRLLHSNLSFPLLKALASAGDVRARRVFKDEIIQRLLSGYAPVVEMLIQERFLDYFSDEEKKSLLESLQGNPEVIHLVPPYRDASEYPRRLESKIGEHILLFEINNSIWGVNVGEQYLFINRTVSRPEVLICTDHKVFFGLKELKKITFQTFCNRMDLWHNSYDRDLFYWKFHIHLLRMLYDVGDKVAKDLIRCHLETLLTEDSRKVIYLFREDFDELLTPEMLERLYQNEITGADIKKAVESKLFGRRFHAILKRKDDEDREYMKRYDGLLYGSIGGILFPSFYLKFSYSELLEMRQKTDEEVFELVILTLKKNDEKIEADLEEFLELLKSEQ